MFYYQSVVIWFMTTKYLSNNKNIYIKKLDRALPRNSKSITCLLAISYIQTLYFTGT